MASLGIYFDGESAADRPVSVAIENGSLVFSGTGVAPQQWRFGEIVAVDPPVAGRPLRLANRKRPGARLVITDAVLVESLLSQAGSLKAGVDWRHVGKIGGMIAAGLAGLGALAYLVLQLAPQSLAGIVPDSWRSRVGVQFETSLVDGARICDRPEGRSALTTMVARLAEGIADLPPISVTVYEMPVMNAFAVPGERIVVTGELIAKAERPEELAGVLAHELGHVVNRHPEAQIIRATGLQLLVSIATGGGGSDAVTSLAGIATILRYSREAEAEADAFALSTMEKAAVDPLGLRHFFELVLQEESKRSSGTLSKLESAFATHPGTEERIKNIHPLPSGTIARPVLDESQWRALKDICKK